jgi:hypothetical protein
MPAISTAIRTQGVIPIVHTHSDYYGVLNGYMDKPTTQHHDIVPARGVPVLDAITDFVRRFVVVSNAQAAVIALWIAHTHVVDAADHTPYLSITSPEKRSGKSRVLELLALLVHRPLRAANASEAALFRSIGGDNPPTVLMDEVDAIFGPKATGNHENLRALLNAGFQRGTPMLRCVGDGAKMEPKAFHVFCPKAFAGIGELPDTIADRSMPIRLKRRAPSEQVEKFRIREARAEAQPLHDQLVEWAAESVDRLAGARPSMPDELDDRAQDVIEPLLAIADLVGGHWPELARRAVVELRGVRNDDETLGSRLLADNKTVFDRLGVDRIATKELIEALSEDDEAPWRTYSHGLPITARKLAGLFANYEVRSRTIRFADETTAKGYLRESFEDAWSRYLPSLPVSSRHNVTTRMEKGIEPVSDPSHETDVTDEKPLKSASINGCDGVTDKTPIPGDEGFLALLDAALEKGFITDLERRQRRLTHFLIQGAFGRDATGEPDAKTRPEPGIRLLPAPEGQCDDKCGRSGRRVWVSPLQVCVPCGHSRLRARAAVAA